VKDMLGRRAFLRTGALGAGGVVLLGGSGLLAACGDDDDASTGSDGDSSGGTPDYGDLKFQLSWIKNVEFAGEYIADKNGYYEDAGFSGVDLLSGGPTVQQDSIVAAGQAFIGISAPDITGPAILAGAPLIAVGALYQKNPIAVMSLAETPISTPEDMVGKKIGVQAVNEPIWNAFLVANDLDPDSITKVPVQFDPQPLTVGEVDGWFSFFTNEPNLLKTQGIETEVFLLADHNYPMVSEIYVVQTSTLTDERDKLKAALMADIKGWRESLKDPALGAQLAAEEYGKDLGLTTEEQTLESESQNTVILTDDTTANGIITITDELVAATIDTLALGGIEITAEKLFDLSVITEVYEENPELKEPV
jgi:ABC-type nitrate/sulfonate/bicarbonate transport system substrate-binding protein